MINLQFLIKNLTAATQRALDSAAASCVANKHFEVAIEHLLLTLAASPECDAFTILRNHRIDTAALSNELNYTLQRMPSGNLRTPSISPPLIRLLSTAWTLASLEFGHTRIRSSVLLLALLETDELLRSVAQHCA